MKLAALLSLAAIAFLISVMLRVKKVQSTKNSEEKSQENSLSAKAEVSLKMKELKERAEKSAGIRPQSNQQRNLDREVGGTEEGKKGSEKENDARVEAHIKDVWDERSEEVDRMGSFNPLAGSAKQAMLWLNKKRKLDAKKHGNSAEILGAASAIKANQKKNVGTNFNSALAGEQGNFMQMVKARQDHSNDFGGGRGGR